MAEDHDHDEEHCGELWRAPDGLSCTRDAVTGCANTEFLPRANQTAPISPLPERNDSGGTENGHNGRGVEHKSGSVPRHEGRSKHPNTKHQRCAVSVSHTSPEQAATHDEGQQEGNGSKRRKELRTVGCVRFCNRSENLGLREVAATGKQHVPSVREFEGLEHVEDGKEHRGKSPEGAEHQQPRLVPESSGHEGDGQGEAEDEQERLQTG